MAENMYNWQYNTIPGNANQGAILLTRNDIGQPPFNQSDFIWKAMEDIIGVANVKFEYDEATNTFHIYKATGHVDNNGNWTYNWEEYGSWDALTEEAAETLKKLVYVDYIFEQTTVGSIEVVTIKGVRKDDTVDVIATLTFVSKAYVDEAISALREYLLVFINKKWEYKGTVQDSTILPDNAPFGSVYGVINESDMFVNIATSGTANWIPFTKIYENYTAGAVKLTKGTNGVYADLRYDSIDFLIDQAQHLKSQIIDDTLDASSPYANRKTYSIDKILQLLSQAMRYKGQVDYYDLLPTTGNVAGDTWNVKYSGTSTQGGTELDGDNYAWNGTGWDDLSGEYRAGVGIQIEGKVISATGIAFNVGPGLMITGSGSNAVLQTRNGNGLTYTNVGTTANPIYALEVKLDGSRGMISTTQDGIAVSVGEGIKFNNNGSVALNHNSDIVITNNQATVPLKTINGNDVHGTGNIEIDSIESIGVTYNTEYIKADQTYIRAVKVANNLVFLCGQINLKTYPDPIPEGTTIFTLGNNFPVKTFNTYFSLICNNCDSVMNCYILAGSRNFIINKTVAVQGLTIPNYSYWVLNGMIV